MRKKTHRRKPVHPFPFISQGISSQQLSIHPHTSRHRKLIRLIRQGARVLFDIKTKRALLYTWERGFTQLCEITVHMLSSLIHSGKVVRVGEERNRVHFAYVGSSSAWFDPEN